MKMFRAVMAAALAFPAVAMAQSLDSEALLQLAADRGTCGELVPVEAWYEPEGSNTIKVRCGEATGFVPVVGAIGLGGGAAAAAAGLALIGVAGGGSSAPPSTN